MSKTAQRKRATYEAGVRDALWGYGFRYLRHPFMESYSLGYRDGLARKRHRLKQERELAARRRWYNRLISWIASRVCA